MWNLFRHYRRPGVRLRRRGRQLESNRSRSAVGFERGGADDWVSKSSSQISLYVILARKAHFGVVFRRGPSKSVLLIGWNTSNDTFEQGQWLKGRIYERRCDLSPDGSLLLYFAANYRKPLYSWSAISRPPFLTALLLWPKGDGWGGGGHFLSQRRIALNHRDNEMQIANGFS